MTSTNTTVINDDDDNLPVLSDARTRKRGAPLISRATRAWLLTIPYNTENKPRGLYFVNALFEGLNFGGAYFRRGLSTEGNLRFKIDWASLIVGRKLTVFALFYLVFEGNFQVQAPVWRGDLAGSFLRYEFGGRMFGGAYTWRGLFSEFYGIPQNGELACRLRLSPLNVPSHLQTQTKICVDGFRASTFHVNGYTPFSCEQ